MDCAGKQLQAGVGNPAGSTVGKTAGKPTCTCSVTPKGDKSKSKKDKGTQTPPSLLRLNALALNLTAAYVIDVGTDITQQWHTDRKCATMKKRPWPICTVLGDENIWT